MELTDIFIRLILSDTFMVEDAVEAIGFGTFQWKLSILTGLAWVSFISSKYSTSSVVNIVSRVCFVCADGRRHGDDDPQHLSAAAPLRVETAQPGGGAAHVGNGL